MLVSVEDIYAKCKMAVDTFMNNVGKRDVEKTITTSENLRRALLEVKARLDALPAKFSQDQTT